uniref:Uncharacterized protein n=1 Tax=Oryza punctata TaxID=4537 RepID=A0A0E0LPF4_ORYPU
MERCSGNDGGGGDGNGVGGEEAVMDAVVDCGHVGFSYSARLPAFQLKTPEDLTRGVGVYNEQNQCCRMESSTQKFRIGESHANEKLLLCGCESASNHFRAQHQQGCKSITRRTTSQAQARANRLRRRRLTAGGAGGAVADDGGLVGASSGTDHGEDLLLRHAAGHLADEQPHPLAAAILPISGHHHRRDLSPARQSTCTHVLQTAVI